jgi:hypothetical protein
LDPAERCWDAAEQRSDFAFVLRSSDRAADAVGTSLMSGELQRKQVSHAMIFFSVLRSMSAITILCARRQRRSSKKLAEHVEERLLSVVHYAGVSRKVRNITEY